MAPSSKSSNRVSPLLPIAEHRQAQVGDSSCLDEASFRSAAGGGAAQGNSSKSGYGKKALRPLVNLKKALVEMLVSEPRSPADSGSNGSSYENPAHLPAFSVSMGMVPMVYM